MVNISKFQITKQEFSGSYVDEVIFLEGLDGVATGQKTTSGIALFTHRSLELVHMS